ncbi:hypothetical protein CHS0354_016597 [Potamilus streckersoni]|uniref:Transforming growth factor beta regulator 1 n=1 Tax=Potamilus streckersoni TaxID=2493646 RepID=A0AAE0TIU7_9BIVA|nr:hypothetical protein CHS0354_016597 [Potamilus streckersoni]
MAGNLGTHEENARLIEMYQSIIAAQGSAPIQLSAMGLTPPHQGLDHTTSKAQKLPQSAGVENMPQIHANKKQPASQVEQGKMSGMTTVLGQGPATLHFQSTNMPGAPVLANKRSLLLTKQALISKPQKYSVGRDPYYWKWRRLKKHMKDLVFLNAAICDEVVRVDEKTAKVREDRRFLLRKLLHYQSVTDGQSPAPCTAVSTSIIKNSLEDTQVTKTKSKKKTNTTSAEKKKMTRDILATLNPKTKRSRPQGSSKYVVPPIPLDPVGRPIFPLTIGDLSIHSVGEIMPDRPGFHTSTCIYPIGFCSTRLFASTHDPQKPCLYTCKVSDGGSGPMFEIVPEDNSEVFQGRSLAESHSMLLRAINKSRGMDVLDIVGKGAEFFGLAHPVVKNLIQSCPGARKCSGYKWVKFEVSKMLSMDSMVSLPDDPAISFPSLKAKLQSLMTPLGNADKSSPNTSLRSLLTGALNGNPITAFPKQLM